MRFYGTGARRRSADINLTPLIDLFLNILVFFMVTTTFAADSVLYVDLPEAESGESESTRQQIIIDIDMEGRIAVDGKPTTYAEMKEDLESEPKERRDTLPVIIRADRGSQHGSVITVIDAVRIAGYRNVGMATERTEPTR